MGDKERISDYAKKIIKLAQDTIIVRFRFFDSALTNLSPEESFGLCGFATDGAKLYYDPVTLLREYLKEPNVAVRVYLHVLLHCIFLHRNRPDKVNEEYWNLATDIAVENTIMELEIPSASLSRDDEALSMIAQLKKNVTEITAEKLYREFMVHGISDERCDNLKRLFTVDFHDNWRKQEAPEEYVVTEEQWKEIARRIKTDLGSFSKGQTGSEELINSIDEATKEKYDYRRILERFMVLGEELTVNDDEFDYIYYMYGLGEYGNMPLIEPLEYKEINKVKDFVIAIDTSASCRGETVKRFVQKTYEILKGTENFFRQINIHIVQCDNSIQSDTKICNDADFREFIEHGKISGFGSTDFRPVFEYVDRLEEDGEFTNLKGLIYFTDGYGIYPELMPSYDVIFAFLNEDKNRQPVPGWAVKVILEDELDEY